MEGHILEARRQLEGYSGAGWYCKWIIVTMRKERNGSAKEVGGELSKTWRLAGK